jgi:hypothetical protein
MTPRTAMISLQEDDQLLDILHVWLNQHIHVFLFSQQINLIMCWYFIGKRLIAIFD